MAARKIDRVRLAQAVLLLVLVASIVVQDRVDGAQTAMLIVGAAAAVGLVVTMALRRASPFPSQNVRREEPRAAAQPQPSPAPAHTSVRRRKGKKR